jgi:hypothetical protein
MKTLIAIVSLLTLAASAQAFAAEASRPARPELRNGQQVLAWRATNSKGSYGQQLKMDERKLAGLIDDLEQGRSVKPADIDRILERANRGSF